MIVNGVSGKLENVRKRVVAEHKPILGKRKEKNPTEAKNALAQQKLRKVVTLKNAQVENT